MPAALCVAPSLSAQADDGAIQSTRAVIRAERQAVVAANLGQTEAESAPFGPLASECRTAVDRAVDTRVAVLKNFFADSETLTDHENLDPMFNLGLSDVVQLELLSNTRGAPAEA